MDKFSIKELENGTYLIEEANGKCVFGKEEDRIIFYDKAEAECILDRLNDMTGYCCVLLTETQTGHYVVVNEWAMGCENGVSILGVEHSINKAKEVFRKYLPDEKDCASTHSWTIFENSDTDFDAGEDGYYSDHHTRLYIQKVN